MATSCARSLSNLCYKTCRKRLIQAVSEPAVFTNRFYKTHTSSQVTNVRNHWLKRCNFGSPRLHHTLCRNSAIKLTSSTSRTVSFVPLRHTSSDSDGSNKVQPQTGQISPIRNPFNMIRDRLYAFIIRVYFDNDFNLDDFSTGARQAVLYISKQISEGAFEKIEEFMSKSLLDDIKTKYNKMAANERKNIAIEDEMVYYPYGIGVLYDNSGSDKIVKVKVMFKCIWGYKELFENQNLENAHLSIRTCDYEFHRDFSPGVTAEWTVTGIKFPSLVLPDKK